MTRELLQNYAPGSGKEDLRGFEWYYWERLSHSYQLDLNGHGSFAECVAFSPDGHRLASGSADRTVKVWDTATGQELFTHKGHHAEVRP